MSSLFYQKIGKIATVHSELFSQKARGEGNRRGVITNNDVFHACIIPEFSPLVKPLLHVFLGFLWF